MEKDNVIRQGSELTIEEQLDEITKWLNANKDRITGARCGVSFVHYRTEGDKTRCSASQILSVPDMISLLDLSLTNLKSQVDPKEPDYTKFLASTCVMLSGIHKSLKPEN